MRNVGLDVKCVRAKARSELLPKRWGDREELVVSVVDVSALLTNVVCQGAEVRCSVGHSFEPSDWGEIKGRSVLIQKTSVELKPRKHDVFDFVK